MKKFVVIFFALALCCSPFAAFASNMETAQNQPIKSGASDAQHDQSTGLKSKTMKKKGMKPKQNKPATSQSGSMQPKSPDNSQEKPSGNP